MPRSLRFFLRTGYTFAATGGASVSFTRASTPLQYFKSAGLADGTACRIRQYHRDHSSSFEFLFLIAASIRLTSENPLTLQTPAPAASGKPPPDPYPSSQNKTAANPHPSPA